MTKTKKRPTKSGHTYSVELSLDEVAILHLLLNEQIPYLRDMPKQHVTIILIKLVHAVAENFLHR